jgi:probable RNA-binding protein EIF1AD
MLSSIVVSRFHASSTSQPITDLQSRVGPYPLFLTTNMGRPKRNVQAAADETSNPPTALTASQFIAKVLKATGNSLYSCSLPDKREILVELPSRFRNTIWIKRWGYVLVDTKDAGVRENKIDGEIINVVRDEREWRKEAYW